MNRTLRMDRRYPLGDYRYVTLEDIVTDVPSDLAFNQGYISTIRYLQLITTELAFRKYKALVAHVGYGIDHEEAIRLLEEIQHKELKNLREFINGDPLDNGDPLKEET